MNVWFILLEKKTMLLSPEQMLKYSPRDRSVRYLLWRGKDHYIIFATSQDATSDKMHPTISKGLLHI